MPENAGTCEVSSPIIPARRTLAGGSCAWTALENDKPKTVRRAKRGDEWCMSVNTRSRDFFSPSNANGILRPPFSEFRHFLHTVRAPSPKVVCGGKARDRSQRTSVFNRSLAGREGHGFRLKAALRVRLAPIPIFQSAVQAPGGVREIPIVTAKGNLGILRFVLRRLLLLAHSLAPAAGPAPVAWALALIRVGR
jgi:hypothetical protein